MKVKNLLLVLFAIFFEYLRDYCFININIYIEFLENTSSGFKVFNYTDSLLLNILEHLKLKTIFIIKWILSLFFASTFFGLGMLFSKWNFESGNHRKFLKYFMISGLILLFSSLIIYSTGKFLSIENEFNFYYVSIELSHFVQSSLYPIIFILIFWSFKLKISSRNIKI